MQVASEDTRLGDVVAFKNNTGVYTYGVVQGIRGFGLDVEILNMHPSFTHGVHQVPRFDKLSGQIVDFTWHREERVFKARGAELRFYKRAKVGTFLGN